MQRTYLNRLAGAVVAAAVLVVGGAWLASDRAHAQIDITGEWTLELSGGVSDSCTVIITQTGSDLVLVAQCGLVGTNTFEGTIDTATGDFTISGFALGIPVELTGTASEDGTSTSGTWTADIGISGTFTSTRIGDVPPPVDVSGDWDILLLGDQVATCTLSITQTAVLSEPAPAGALPPETDPGTGGGGGVDEPPPPTDPPFPGPPPGPGLPGAELSAALDCGSLGAGTLDGFAYIFDGTFNLFGTIGGVEWNFYGQPDADVSSLTGSWFYFDPSDGGPEPVGAGGTFMTLAPGQADAGVVVFDCDGESAGVQEFCGYPVGDEFTGQVHVALAPAGGYSGFEIQMEFLNGVAQLSPPAEAAVEVLSPSCGTPQITVGDGSVGLNCPAGAVSTGTGPLAAFSFGCEAMGSEDFSLGDGTRLLDAAGTPVQPLVFGGSVFCFDDTILPGVDDGLGGDGRGGDFASPEDGTVGAPQTGAGPSPEAAPLLQIVLLGLGGALLGMGGLALYRRRVS